MFLKALHFLLRHENRRTGLRHPHNIKAIHFPVRRNTTVEGQCFLTLARTHVVTKPNNLHQMLVVPCSNSNLWETLTWSRGEDSHAIYNTACAPEPVK